ncbi:hypothetical protein QFZ79_001404 [Arthrobacter sp. V4I6]|nr:hypothetical protein [Arthrobacter sp. V4I6]MDQ0853293.1 hypothetical protein [Arthrobacter sp. V4I6]
MSKTPFADVKNFGKIPNSGDNRAVDSQAGLATKVDWRIENNKTSA